MRLLFIWPNLGDGGGELALINLVMQLKDTYQIHILCCDKINIFTLPHDVNVTYVCEPSQKKIVRLFNKFIYFFKWLKISKTCDLQIINDAPIFSIMAPFISFITRKKYLIWVHSCRGDRQINTSKLFRVIHKQCLLYADEIVCVSNHAAQSMCDYMGIELHLPVVYNILQFNLPASNNLQLPNDIIKICAVGRLSHEKNFPLLLDALASAMPLVNHVVHLYICGQGIELERLTRKSKQLNLTKYVTFTGYVRNAISYISQCDILVSSSDSEALPTVICEALYYNKAVIATNTGASDILQNGKFGIIVQRRNVSMLSDALIKLINNKDLREQYATNAKHALDPFNNDKILNQWHDLIKLHTK